MDFNLLSAITTQNACATAFSDYMDNICDNYSKLVSMLDEALLPAEDVNDEGEAQYTTSVSTIVSRITTEYNINSDTLLTFSRGHAKLGDVLTAFIQKSRLVAETTTGSASALQDEVINMVDHVGYPITTHLSVTDVMDEVKATMRSSVVMGAAASASIHENVSDRLQAFTSKVKAVFKDPYDDTSGSFAQFQNLLAQPRAKASDIMMSIGSMIGLKENATEDDFTVAETDIYQYTGSSPVAALDFSTATKVLETTGKVIGAAVYGVFNAVWSIAKTAARWASRKLRETFINPMDIKVIDEKADAYSIDGWSFCSKEFTSGESAGLTQYLNDEINAMMNHWYKFETIFGEILFRYDSWDRDDHGNLRVYDCQITFKPYCINFKALPRSVRAVGTVGEGKFCRIGWEKDLTANEYKWKWMANLDYNSQAFADFVSGLGVASADPNFYLEPGLATENEMYNGFSLALLLMYGVMSCQCDIISGAHSSMPINGWNLRYKYDDEIVTNADFVQIASGWDKDLQNPTYNLSNLVVTDVGNNMDNEHLFHKIFSCLMWQLRQKHTTPLTYMFIPYNKDTYGFSNSRFSLKTDEDNDKALTAFLTIAVIVVITAVVAISAVAIIKKIQKKRFWKMQEFVGQKDNAMWNGETLTAAEKRKYRRYAKRLNASNYLTGGLAASSDDAKNILSEFTSSGQTDSYTQLFSIIHG